MAKRGVVKEQLSCYFDEQSLPPPLEDDVRESLVAQLSDASTKVEAVEKLILSNLRLAVAITAEYVIDAHSVQDELLGVALLKLTEAVNRYGEKKRESSLTGYIVSYMRGGIINFLTSRSLVRMPHRTVQDRRTKGKTVNLPKVVGAIVDHGVPHHFQLDTIEMLKACLTTRNERLVTFFRLQGCNDPEIGVKIGRSYQRVHQIRTTIKQKIKEYVDERTRNHPSD